MRPQKYDSIISAPIKQMANTMAKENEGVGYPIFPYWSIFFSSQ